MREETRAQERAAMRLPASEVARFYTLYPAVLLYANQQLGLARQVTTIPQLMAMSEEEQYLNGARNSRRIVDLLKKQSVASVM